MPLITLFVNVSILRYLTLEFQSVSLEPITDPWYSGILLLTELGHKRFITGAEVLRRGEKSHWLSIATREGVGKINVLTSLFPIGSPDA